MNEYCEFCPARAVTTLYFQIDTVGWPVCGHHRDKYKHLDLLVKANA